MAEAPIPQGLAAGTQAIRKYLNSTPSVKNKVTPKEPELGAYDIQASDSL